MRRALSEGHFGQGVDDDDPGPLSESEDPPNASRDDWRSMSSTTAAALECRSHRVMPQAMHELMGAGRSRALEVARAPDTALCQTLESN